MEAPKFHVCSDHEGRMTCTELSEGTGPPCPQQSLGRLPSSSALRLSPAPHPRRRPWKQTQGRDWGGGGWGERGVLEGKVQKPSSPLCPSSLPRASRSHRAPSRAETWSQPSVRSGDGPRGPRLRSELVPAQPHTTGMRKTAAGGLGLCGCSEPATLGSWGEAPSSCGRCCCLTNQGFHPH